MDLKDIIAAGGLFLGIVNLWLIVFRHRPFLFKEPIQPQQFTTEDAPQLRVCIVNPSQSPVQISRLSILGGRKSKFYILSTDKTRSLNGVIVGGSTIVEVFFENSFQAMR